MTTVVALGKEQRDIRLKRSIRSLKGTGNILDGRFTGC